MVRTQKKFILTNPGGTRLSSTNRHKSPLAKSKLFGQSAWVHHPQTVEREIKVVVILGSLASHIFIQY